MNPILATNLFSIGKEIINKVTSDFSSTSRSCQSQFSSHLNSLEKTESSAHNHNIKLQKLETTLKAELLKDPKTANFFQQNQSNQIFLEKRADGSVQFISSSGQNHVLDKNSPSCSLANELYSLCFENKLNLTAMRPNAVIFNI